jgi:hypothetical protein
MQMTNWQISLTSQRMPEGIFVSEFPKIDFQNFAQGLLPVVYPTQEFY